MSWWKKKPLVATAVALVTGPQATRIEGELVEDSAEYDPDYSVVYYRYSGKWAAMYKGVPLYHWYGSGKVEPDNRNTGWTHCPNERAAWRLCNMHREQKNGAPLSDVHRTPSYDRK